MQCNGIFSSIIKYMECIHFERLRCGVSKHVYAPYLPCDRRTQYSPYHVWSRKNSPRIQASSAAVYPQLFGKSVHQQIWSPGFQLNSLITMDLTTLWLKIFAPRTYFLWNLFKIKLGYNARCHWLKERALLEYKTWSWAFTLSAKLYYVRPFPRLLSSFFYCQLKGKFCNKRDGK